MRGGGLHGRTKLVHVSFLLHVFHIYQDGPHASQLTAPPAGFDSVVAKGKFSPDGEWNGSDTHAELVLDGNKVKVPQSALKKTGVNSTFHHNEILV